MSFRISALVLPATMALLLGIAGCKTTDVPAPKTPDQHAAVHDVTAPSPGPAQPPGVAPGGAKPVSEAEAARLQQALDDLAASCAAGAEPLDDGGLMGNFQQGQVLEAVVQLQPGKCYTVVAVGLQSTSEVDVQLTEVEPPLRVLAQDDDSGSEAVVGRPPECFAWNHPTAGRVRLVLHVRKGGGIAGAQIYCG